MKPDDCPFWVDDSPTAADEAKEFCRISGLTPHDAKIVRRDGRVMVVITRLGAKIRMPK